MPLTKKGELEGRANSDQPHSILARYKSLLNEKAPLSLGSDTSSDASFTQEQLTRFFGEKAHVMDLIGMPGSPIIPNDALTDGVYDILKKIRKPLLIKNGVISKPIIILLPDSMTAGTIETSSAWKAIIILPANYLPLATDKPLGNLTPLYCYFDPQTCQPNQLPESVAQLGLLMIHGGELPVMIDGYSERQVVRIKPFLPPMIFKNLSRIMCQDPSDTLAWSISFSAMFLSTGVADFNRHEVNQWLSAALPSHVVEAASAEAKEEEEEIPGLINLSPEEDAALLGDATAKALNHSRDNLFASSQKKQGVDVIQNESPNAEVKPNP